MKLRISAITLGAIALLSGCGGTTAIESGFPDGGGNGGGAQTPVPTGPGIDGGAITRTFRAGDTWEYDLSGQMLKEVFDYTGKTITKLQGPVTGRMVRQLTSTTLGGAPVFKVTDSISYSINGGLTTVEVTESYARQEADGSLTLLGRRDQSTDTRGPAGIRWIPGTWASGASVGGNERQVATNGYPNTFFDISTSMNATNSEGVRSSSTPFTTWRTVYADTMHKEWDIPARINAGETTTQGFILRSDDAVQSIEWWSPILGAPVQRQYKSTRRDAVVNDVKRDPTTGAITVEYHSENRTLDVLMVLRVRSLN